LRVPVSERKLITLGFEGTGLVESVGDAPVVALAQKGELQASAGRKSAEKKMAGGFQRAPESMSSIPAIAVARTITRPTSIALFAPIRRCRRTPQLRRTSIFCVNLLFVGILVRFQCFDDVA
jgi:hypothetical protein